MPTLLDLWLTAALGFLGSFGHCVGMCGPITAAFALSASPGKVRSQSDSLGASQVGFHLLLNLGRLMSYMLVGMLIGALGSVVFAGGQIAGVGSDLRRWIALLTGLLLVWFGIAQISPSWLPPLPLMQPTRQAQIHTWISTRMNRLSQQTGRLTPLFLGLLWGLIPCGFLYAGQLRAAATQSWQGGALVMLAFGAGTLPAMVTMGIVTSALSQDRRSQLFRLGGFITVIVGLLLLLRTGDTMVDYSGYGAIICLMLALIARPISRLWTGLLKYRRILGVGAFVLSCLHVLHMVSHTWQWNLRAIAFMLPSHRWGIWLGAIALLLMLPAALTSFDFAQKKLGTQWRKIHLLSIPALLLAAVHTLMTGATFWGTLSLTWRNHLAVGILVASVVGVMGVRSRRCWTVFSQTQHYAPATHTSTTAAAGRCCSSQSSSSESY